MWKNVFAWSLIAVVGALLVSRVVAADASGSLAIGAPAPSFELQDQDGRTVKPSDFPGKIIVLEWFNEECPIVQRHYKDDVMNKLATKYRAKGVVWLAINSTSGKTIQTNKKADVAWKMNRPILNDAKDQKVAKSYKATNTPGMYIVDTKGMLAYWGAVDDNATGSKTTGIKNYVAQALDELLEGRSVSESKTQPYGCTVKYAD